MNDHKLEKRPRQIDELYCLEEGCEFNDKLAQQGICYSADHDSRDWEKIFDAGKHMGAELLAIRTSKYADKPDEYIRWLEAMYETAMMNWASTLDECICLRVENRRLKEAKP